MLCQNCGKNEVNFRYTQIINGVKKEMALCDKCAKSLGLENLDFNMPINFSSFLGDFFGGAETDFLPSFTKTATMKCDNCGMTYDEFIDTGKFGCSHCYDIFADGLDNVLKNIHGSARHVGRRSNLSLEDKRRVEEDVQKVKGKKATQVRSNNENEENRENTNNSKAEKIKILNANLKKAIKEERYEDAAKIRDEIKKLS